MPPTRNRCRPRDSPTEPDRGSARATVGVSRWAPGQRRMVANVAARSSLPKQPALIPDSNRHSAGSSLTDSAAPSTHDRRQRAQPADGHDVGLSEAADVVHDVSLDATWIPVESGHVHPIKTHSPDVDAVRDRARHVAEHHVVTDRAEDRPGSDHVLAHRIQGLPLVREDVRPASDPPPHPVSHHPGDVAVGISGLLGLRAGEEA